MTPTELIGRQKVLQTAFQRLLDSKGKHSFSRADLFKHASPQSTKSHWQQPICNALTKMGVIVRSGPSTSPLYTFSNTEVAQEELTNLMNSKKMEDIAKHPALLRRQLEPSQEAMFDDMHPDSDLDYLEQPEAQELDVATAVTNVSKAVYAISEAVLYVRQVQESNEEMLASLADGQAQINKNLESLTSLIELFLNATQNTDPNT